MSVKQPFELLADELTLLRDELAYLKSISLTKQEARSTHQIFVAGIKSLEQQSATATKVFTEAAGNLAGTLTEASAQAAQKAIEAEIEKFRSGVDEAAQRLSTSAAEARRAAFTYYGGFWVWLAAAAALGAFVAVLLVIWLEGRADAKEFGRFPSIFCQSAGGEKITQKNGAEYCAFLLTKPTS